MFAKLIFKALFIIAMLAFLVLMGMNNRNDVTFMLSPLVDRPIKLPSAMMYYGFFAIGFLTGAILFAGGGKKGASSTKASKGE
jgi:hypothetical protein